MSLIVLTTHPTHKSKNVGDALITTSACKLLENRILKFTPKVLFREESLDSLSSNKKYSILAPGFSIAEGTYPKLFSLFSNLSRMAHFWPVGCSFQSSCSTHASFTTPYGFKTLTFLKNMSDRWGPFPCRDELIVNRLSSFDIPAYYFGDLGLFDENKIYTEMTAPRKMMSFVITLGHHLEYHEQTIDLAKKLARKYPEARRYVSLHSVPSTLHKNLVKRLIEIGYQILYLFGNASNLEAYNDIDFHIGYRLHGHIYFLRTRKPSILLVEDARAFGFAETAGTAFGCINACDPESPIPNDSAPDQAISLLSNQLNLDFAGYSPVFQFIDATYENVVKPYFDRVASQLVGGDVDLAQR